MRLALVALASAALALVGGARASTASCAYRDGGALPDKTCTPGATFSRVTQATIRKTICVPGWTATVRPPLAVTEHLKRSLITRYGYAFGAHLSGYELDHLIPLELGGNPSDVRNLWPEPHAVAGQRWGSYEKDRVENRLHAEVCAGKITLRAARRAIRTDWRTAP